MCSDFCAQSAEGRGLPASETHDIVLAPGSRVVRHSEGLGWTDVYAVITSERQWSGTLQPIEHTCFSYCLRRSVKIERQIQGEDRPVTGILRPRQFGFLPTRVASSWRLTGTADVMMVYLGGSLVERTARQLFGVSARDFEIPPQIGVLDPLLEQLALEIVAALNRQNKIDDRHYIGHIAALAAAHLLRHHGQRRAASVSHRPSQLRLSLEASLSRVRNHIDERLDRDLCLVNLAREAGLSPTAFTQAFTTAYGDTPHQYVIKRRVERTKHLLIGTDLPIAEIALRTGFSSQSHLSEVFKRTTGETPRHYRSALDPAPAQTGF